ncbi:MAG TPA: GntR family transcriptional regulator [Beijerinckiaceae bacterium]|jgi:DNA-binding GntR family transcriptional regulator
MDTGAHKGARYAFLKPLARGPRGDTTERVERALRRAVVELAFAPGEFIDKAAVCARLGVSRFPVSEALARLASEGLVEILPQRGSRAARLRLPEIAEAMMIRRSLEAAVAERAAFSLSEAGLEALRTSVAAQEQAVAADDRARFHAEDLAFHEVLVRDLARVGAVIDASRANIDRVRRLLWSPRRHAVTLAEHRVILDALERRDPAGARQAMEAHLDAVMAELDRFSAAHPEVLSGSAPARPARALPEPEPA